MKDSRFVEPVLLLIEDNPDDVALAKRALARSGTPVRLQIASNVRDGLAILSGPNEEEPRAVFVDLNMPEYNGFDFLRMVREQPQFHWLPLVVLTTSSSPEDVERSYELGANSFVTKPLDFAEFQEVFATMSRYWLKINHLPR